MKKTDRIRYSLAAKRHFRGMAIWHRLLPQLFPSMLLSKLFEKGSPFVTVYLSARILDALSLGSDARTVWTLVAVTLAATALLGITRACLKRWYDVQEAQLYYKREKLYSDKMSSMDFADTDRQYASDLLSQIRENENWSGWGLPRVISGTASVLEAGIQILCGVGLSVSLFLTRVGDGMGAFTVLNHPLFALLVPALMVAAAFLSGALFSRAEAGWSDYAANARLGNRIFSAYGFFSGEKGRALDIRIYSQERISSYYTEKQDRFSRSSAIARAFRGKLGICCSAAEGISALMTGLIYLFVCLKAYAGAFGIGSVTQYIGAIMGVFQGIGGLFTVLAELRTNGEFLENTYSYLDIPNDMYQGSLTTEKRADRIYEVEFRDVSFRYPESDSWALRHVSMKFEIGKRIAVVGRNGSGKTTFIKLLCRLYDPTQGQILLNGIDIRKYRYDEYMRLFSVVFQDFKLVALPLGENVAAGSRYDAARVEDCLKKAGFAARLDAMPHKLETYLFKDLQADGVDVSGGEAQKIAIARALYPDTPFIILDEPTAALDPIAEAEIYSGFDAIIEDKTAVYISHRLSSCRFCDKILVFDSGSIVQQGNHDTLVADTANIYAQLWNAQAQYYTPAQ